MRISSSLKIIYNLLILVVLLMIIIKLNNFVLKCSCFYKSSSTDSSLSLSENDAAAYTEYATAEKPIFIGGYPRSGTSLMRAILDSHPNISCGPETKIIPGLLEWYANFRSYYNETELLKGYFANAHIKEQTLNTAMADFIRTVMINRDIIPKSSSSSSNSHSHSHMCSKDPLDAKYIKRLNEFFPQMKFILMVRDLRAVAHSFLWRIKLEQNLKYDPVKLIQDWNTNVNQYVRDCKQVGADRCMIVIYEQLVQNKQNVLSKIMRFLNIEWAASMMNHEKFIGDRVFVHTTEWSAAQIVKPTYTDSIDAWVGKLPDDVLKLIADSSSSSLLLKQLGYDPKANTSMNNTPL